MLQRNARWRRLQVRGLSLCLSVFLFFLFSFSLSLSISFRFFLVKLGLCSSLSLHVQLSTGCRAHAATLSGCYSICLSFVCQLESIDCLASFPFFLCALSRFLVAMLFFLSFSWLAFVELSVESAFFLVAVRVFCFSFVFLSITSFSRSLVSLSFSCPATAFSLLSLLLPQIFSSLSLSRLSLDVLRSSSLSRHLFLLSHILRFSPLLSSLAHRLSLSLLSCSPRGPLVSLSHVSSLTSICDIPHCAASPLSYMCTCISHCSIYFFSHKHR